MSWRKRFGIAIAGFLVIAAAVVVVGRPPNFLSFYVWKAVPGVVTDSEGRAGQLYRSSRGILEVVVFNRGGSPQIEGPLDQWLVPPPAKTSVYLMYTVNLKSKIVGLYNSDRVFRDFLLSRINGDAWSGDGGLAVVKSEGHPNTYLLTNFNGQDQPSAYTVKFQIR